MNQRIEFDRDDRGWIRFRGLTAEQEAVLLGDLQIREPERRQKALASLERVLTDFDIAARRERLSDAPADERDKAERAIKAIRGARQALKDLGLEARICINSWAELDEEYPSLAHVLRDLETYDGFLCEFVDVWEIPRGRPPLRALKLAVLDLAFVYKAFTRKAPTMPSPDRSYDGAFLRFCVAVLGVLGSETGYERKNVANAVCEVVVEGREKSGPNWPILPPGAYE